MKKALKIILGIFLSLVALIVIAVTIFACTNRELAKGAFDLLLSAPGNNIKAAWLFITTDSEGLDQKITDNTAKYSEAINNVLGDLGDNQVSLNEEVMAALDSGEYTEEEMTRIIVSGGAELENIKKEKEQAAASGEASDNTTSEKADAEKEPVVNTDKAEEPDNTEKNETEQKNEVSDSEKTDSSSQSNPSDKTEGVKDNKPAEKTEDTKPANVENDKKTDTTGSKNDPVKNDTASAPDTSVSEDGNEDYDEYYPDGYPDPVVEEEPADETETVQPQKPVSSETTQPQTPPASEQPQTPAAPQPVTSDDTAATIAKLYVVKSRFVGELTSLEGTIKSAYGALPKEQRVPASRKSIAGQYISVVANLEAQCDAEVDAILAELTTKLQQQGKDTSVVATLRSAYENEKSLKKAYYMDVYMNGI